MNRLKKRFIMSDWMNNKRMKNRDRMTIKHWKREKKFQILKINNEILLGQKR